MICLLVRVYDSMISINSVSSEKLQCYTQNCYRSISNTIFVSGVDSGWSVYSLAALATVCCSWCEYCLGFIFLGFYDESVTFRALGSEVQWLLLYLNDFRYVDFSSFGLTFYSFSYLLRLRRCTPWITRFMVSCLFIWMSRIVMMKKTLMTSGWRQDRLQIWF